MNVVQTVLIAIVFLIIIYYVIQWFTTKSVKLSTMQKGTSTTTISASKLKNNNVGNFTYSIWYYIDDWNSNYGKQKTLMRLSNKDGGTGPSMHINLGETENNINITVRCYNEDGGGSCPTECETCGYISTVAGKSSLINTCSDICYTDSDWPTSSSASGKALTANLTGNVLNNLNKKLGGANPYCVGGIGDAYFNKNTGKMGTKIDCSTCSGNGSSKMSTCTVSNFPLQKWVNLTVSVYGRTLDVYLDGKLTHTCVLPGPANMNNLNNIVITPQGAGFDGYTSDLTYYPTASNPQEAYNIYKSGFGGSSMSNILNKYRVQISFLENNEEQWHVDI